MNTIKKRDSKFTQVSNDFLRDNNISFKAKGLFCYMFSMSDGWNFTMQSISTQQKDGVASVSSAMDELKEFGYVKYEKHSDGKGTYYLNDEPKCENQYMDNAIMGKSHPIKNTQLSKNKNNKTSILDEYIQEDKSITLKGIEIVKDFIEYRKIIKHPIKTTAPIKAYVSAIRELLTKGFTVEEIISIQKEKEWQTIKVEWVEKSITPQNKPKLNYSEQKELNQDIKVEVYKNGNYKDANGEIRDINGYIV